MSTITNRYPGNCINCDVRVESGGGVTAKRNGRWVLWCAEHDPNRPVEFVLPEVESVEVAGTNAERLMPHQAAVVAAVQSGSRALYLADEPGLGKTATSLVSAAAAGAQRTVVVVPAVVKTNWAREVEMWTPGRETLVLDGRKSAPIPAGIEVVIINYDILSAHLDAILAWRPPRRRARRRTKDRSRPEVARGSRPRRRHPARRGGCGMSTEPEPVVVTRAVAARMLSVSPRTLLRWDADPEIDLAPVVLGGVVRYRVADIRELVEKKL